MNKLTRIAVATADGDRTDLYDVETRGDYLDVTSRVWALASTYAKTREGRTLALSNDAVLTLKDVLEAACAREDDIMPLMERFGILSVLYDEQDVSVMRGSENFYRP